MTLIRKDLYNDLIAVRTTLLAQVEDATNQVKEIEAKIKLMEDFIAGFDKTQADLQASIENFEEAISANHQNIDKQEEKANQIQQQIEDLKQREELKQRELMEAKDKGEPQEVIDKLEAEVVVLKNQVALNQKDLDAVYNSIELIKSNIEDSERSIKDSKMQLIENESKKSTYEEDLPETKVDLEVTKDKLDSVNAEYSDFLAKNQATINAFENQQLRRDANIPKKDTTKAFNRVPANASVKQEADEVMKTVVEDELKPANPDEDTQRKEWISAGQEKNVNPDFLNAADARSLAYSNMWSTKVVASQIKEAAEKGELSVSVSSLPNNVIYALQEAGYAISMTDVDVDVNSHIIISWENLGAK